MMFWMLSKCCQNFTSKKHFLNFSLLIMQTNLKMCCSVNQEIKSEILCATGVFYANEFYLQFNINNNDETD